MHVPQHVYNDKVSNVHLPHLLLALGLPCPYLNGWSAYSGNAPGTVFLRVDDVDLPTKNDTNVAPSTVWTGHVDQLPQRQVAVWPTQQLHHQHHERMSGMQTQRTLAFSLHMTRPKGMRRLYRQRCVMLLTSFVPAAWLVSTCGCDAADDGRSHSLSAYPLHVGRGVHGGLHVRAQARRGELHVDLDASTCMRHYVSAHAQSPRYLSSFCTPPRIFPG